MAEQIHDAERLAELQALPLERKIQITQTRIIEWYQRYNGKVCVSFSGGKDSTVLLHIARQIYPDIPAVFSNTGLEYPEIQRFAKSVDNIDIVTPSMRFDQVISTYGYPLISKEVAEAIYYARRIRSQTVQVERERERERGRENAPNSWEDAQQEADGSKDSYVEANAHGQVTPPHTHKAANRTPRDGQMESTKMLEADRRRDNLCGRLHGRDWKLGGESEAYQDKHSEEQTDSSQRENAWSLCDVEWKYWQRGYL